MNIEQTWETLSTSSEETEQLAEQLAKLLSGGETIALQSDLGGGKTTFVKGLVRGLGSNNQVSSPTFTLNNTYQCEKKTWKIDHFDLYRLSKPGILARQLAESINNQTAITIIEWPEKFSNLLPNEHICITIKPLPHHLNHRRLIFQTSKNLSWLIEKLNSNWKGSISDNFSH